MSLLLAGAGPTGTGREVGERRLRVPPKSSHHRDRFFGGALTEEDQSLQPSRFAWHIAAQAWQRPFPRLLNQRTVSSESAALSDGRLRQFLSLAQVLFQVGQRICGKLTNICFTAVFGFVLEHRDGFLVTFDHVVQEPAVELIAL
jgi:hypothetical protein